MKTWIYISQLTEWWRWYQKWWIRWDWHQGIRWRQWIWAQVLKICIIFGQIKILNLCTLTSCTEKSRTFLILMNITLHSRSLISSWRGIWLWLHSTSILPKFDVVWVEFIPSTSLPIFADSWKNMVTVKINSNFHTCQQN